MGRNQRHITCLDIGTSTIRCAIVEPRGDGSVQVLGLGKADSRGLRKGVVVNLASTVEAVKSAVAEAEAIAGFHVNSAILGIAGGHIRSFDSRGVVAVGGRKRVVSEEDHARVIEQARSVSIPDDREVLHVLPQEFVLDEQGSISSPIGLVGSKLEANVHIVTGAATATQNRVTCGNLAGVEIQDTVFEQIAAAEAVLTDDDRELGVALIDIGGGTSEMSIFERGSLAHTSVLPVGGNHFTNDLAIGLRTPVPDAERLKLRYGYALASMVEEDEAIDVPTVGGGKTRLLSRQVMAEILQPRAEEIFTLFHEKAERAGFARMINAGVVLTGGGSMLPGMAGVAEQVFDVPVRFGQPQGIAGLVEPPVGPDLAMVLGLGLYGARNELRRPPRRPVMQGNKIVQAGDRVRTWFTQMF